MTVKEKMDVVDVTGTLKNNAFLWKMPRDPKVQPIPLGIVRQTSAVPDNLTWKMVLKFLAPSQCEKHINLALESYYNEHQHKRCYILFLALEISSSSERDAEISLSQKPSYAIRVVMGKFILAPGIK